MGSMLHHKRKDQLLFVVVVFKTKFYYILSGILKISNILIHI